MSSCWRRLLWALTKCGKRLLTGGGSRKRVRPGDHLPHLDCSALLTALDPDFV